MKDSLGQNKKCQSNDNWEGDILGTEAEGWPLQVCLHRPRVQKTFIILFRMSKCSWMLAKLGIMGSVT